MSAHTYPGEELDLFSQAHNWKSYWSSRIRPYLGRDVLEVGAGIGANTARLASGHAGRWVCLEPDPALAARIPERLQEPSIACKVEIVTGIVDDMPDGACFDTALYIDVLEHIEDDRAELAKVSRHLRPGGAIIVLAPAHPFLFSSFDSAVGHYRRYTRATLLGVTPGDAALIRLDYLDVAGILTSLANRALLRQPKPAPAQIRFWDTMLVPVSRRVDALLGYNVGKSILAVWRMPG